ncbi:MAG TPA: FAD-dependent monooxygenase [Phototrophicaceae bacterium]|jgi:flavin-dependent dehydrogenase|nr:FAD-dependent monooxygenase [Phototrophicaceae bacterium]
MSDQTNTTAGTHAIVIGGSMAGLMHARVLAKHFGRVTIIERDNLPDAPDFRGGVPQGRHVHALLAKGQALMEELFPGLDQDFVAIGAPRYTWGKDTVYLTAGGWIKRFDTGIDTNLISRTALEYLIRRRLMVLCPNVSFMPQTDVLSLIAEGDTVTGVQIQSRTDKTEQNLSANLVVDASGRASKCPEWLQALGYAAPEETEVKSYIGYATRWYEAPANRPDWKLMFIVGRPAENIKRGGAIFEVEDNKWVVTLGGVNQDYPPTDEAEFLEYAKSLPTPAFYDAIKNAKPISPIYGYRITGNRLRHFEKMTRRPENFIVTGDAACGFNPQYGQGMTVAAMEAQMLDGLLKGRQVTSLRGFAAQFQQGLAKTISNAWLLATGEDLRYEGTEGDRPNLVTRMIQRYLDLVFKYTLDDPQVVKTVIQVTNLAAAPTTLFSPYIFFRLISRLVRRESHQPEDNLTVVPTPIKA